MKFTEEHEWLRIEDDVVVVGITEHASTQLGDIVFVELPEEGQTLSKDCLLYTSPSPRDQRGSRMPSSA